jgi:hypothetical protein
VGHRSSFGLANTEQAITPKIGCRMLNQEWDLHEELHRHRGAAARARGERRYGKAAAAARTTTVPNS